MGSERGVGEPDLGCVCVCEFLRIYTATIFYRGGLGPEADSNYPSFRTRFHHECKCIQMYADWGEGVERVLFDYIYVCTRVYKPNVLIRLYRSADIARGELSY